MACFALYRLPDQCEVTRIASAHEPLEMQSCTDLNDCKGFVLAPFTPSPSTPILVIEPEEISQFVPETYTPHAGYDITTVDREHNRAVYADNFIRCHNRLTDGTFRKIVLARRAEVRANKEIQALNLFYKACELYPHQFISLVHTSISGTWLTASPEVLLQGHGEQWNTVALAGTMSYRDNNIGWSVKNIREQRLVANYIQERLAKWSENIDRQGPTTARAGALLHLKDTFNFTLPDTAHIGSLLDDLYPTPAVCGLPKEPTRAFIMKHESPVRNYYSGFMGPIAVHNNSSSTHLYVSLHCMQIAGNTCQLYAGGGLISDSTEQQEWEETEAKMKTMLNCLK